MKTSRTAQLFTLVAGLYLTDVALAGVHVESVTRDVTTKAPQGGTQTLLVQDGVLRSSGSGSGSVILNGSTIIMIDDKRKQYREMTREDMKKMAATAGDAMAKMREKMKNMTPEQRAMMEKMMGDKLPGGFGAVDKPDTWESKNLGTTDTVEGRKCTNWDLIRNGAPFEQLCVVPYASLPGKEDFQKVFKEMAEAFGDLAKQVPGADQTVKARTAVNGYPVRTRLYTSDGKFRSTETVMTKWVEESIPASAFEVPKGYTKQELPKRPN